MRLLDLFCGAGGAAVGYNRAGFTEIVGIDLKPQPRYPYDFIQADALAPPVKLELFDLIHASPPCQRWSVSTAEPEKHPDLITPLRPLLLQSRTPYVIENVPHAPIRCDLLLCGSMVGLKHIRRHRHFEIHPQRLILTPPHAHTHKVISVVGHGSPSGTHESWGRNPTIDEKRAAMGIEWMNRDELSQAVPPAYTEFIGKALLPYLT